MIGTPSPEGLNKKEVCTYSFTLRKRPQVKDECCTIRSCSPDPEDLNKKEQRFTVSKGPPCAEELRKKEQCLHKKEKELIKLQKCIEKQRSQLKKKFHDKAKADLKAAKKLNRARKKLQLTVNATTKIGRCDQKKQAEKKQSLSCTKCMDTQYRWTDKIHSMFEKYVNVTGKIGRCDQKKQPEKKQSLSCTKCMDTQYRWTDKIHSMFEKYVNVTGKIGRCDQKDQLEIKQTLSCIKPMDTQYKWLDKIHSMMENFHGNFSSSFCERRRGFTELCALYVKKIKEAYHCAEVDSGCTRSSNLDHFFGNRPYRSSACSRLESAAGDCYGMAMGPVMWSWPSPRPPCRVELKQAGYFLALIASFLFWLPCLFCVALMCCCCDCS